MVNSESVEIMKLETLETGNWKLETGIWKLELGTWNLEPGTRNPETAQKL